MNANRRHLISTLAAICMILGAETAVDAQPAIAHDGKCKSALLTFSCKPGEYFDGHGLDLLADV
ncbi:MAG TPA: hypothetical protein PKJ44_05140, partial [Thauera aminoaromatica]|nr:hypothetical protein [Thauera aminoaromatica]